MFKVKRTTGNVFKLRLEIKGFKTSEAMHKFLNSQDNNDWSEFRPDLTSRDNLAPGVYAYVGQRWVNVKKLDPLTLAHV